MKNWKTRALAFILTLAMAVSNIFSTGALTAFAAPVSGNDVGEPNNMGGVDPNGDGPGNDDIQITNFQFQYYDVSTKTWKDITSGMTIEDGSKVRLYFDWSVLNSNDHTDDDVTVTVPLELLGIRLDTKNNSPYTDSSHNDMGTYSINNNTFTLTINKDYFNSKSNRSGNAYLDGTLKVENNESKDSQDTQIGFASSAINVTVSYNISDSYVKAEKTAGSLVKEGDNLYQEYTVKLTGMNADVTNFSLEDVPGTKLSFDSSYGYKVDDTTYASLDDVAAAYVGDDGKVAKNDTMTFSYRMLVDPSIYKKASNVGVDGSNKILASYKNNKGEDKTFDNWENHATVQIKKPNVSKGAGDISDDGEIVWTVNIDCGDLDWADVDLSNVTDTYTEKNILGTTIDTRDLTTVSPSIRDKSNWTMVSEGKYTYTYTTTASATAMASKTDVAISNNVDKIKINGEDYNASVGKTLKGSAGLKKELVGDGPDENGVLSWKSTIEIPAGMKVNTFFFEDSTQKSHTDNANGVHTMYDATHPLEVYVDGNLAFRLTGSTISDVDTNIIQARTAQETTYGETEYFLMYFSSTFLDNLNSDIENDREVVITYKTVVADANSAQKTYRNWSKAMIGDVSGGQFYPEGTAEWKDENVSLMHKKGTTTGADIGDDRAKFEVRVDLADYDSLKAGDVLTFDDDMETGLHYDGLEYAMVTEYYTNSGFINQWSPGLIDCKSALSYDSSAKAFSLTVTQAMVDYLAAAPSAEMARALAFAYYAAIDDPLAYAEAGETKSFTNKIFGKINTTPIGFDSTQTPIVPKQVVEKSTTYTEETAPYMNFTIKVNPMGADLNALGDRLKAVDTMGDALVYKENSIKVVNSKTSATISDYTFKYDVVSNTITMELPDNTPILITYSAKLLLFGDIDDQSKGDQLTFENSGNTFALTGITQTDTSSEYSTARFAYASNVQGDGDIGSIELFKFYNDATGEVQTLGGSTFKVYKTTYNETTQKWEVDTTELKGTYALEDDVNHLVIEDLTADMVYALVETGAKSGFKVNPEPMFFAVRGKNYTTDVKEKDVHDQVKPIYSTAYMPYENIPATGPELTIKKTLDGLTTDAEKNAAIANIRFDVKAGDTVVATRTITADDYAEGVYTKKISLDTVGTYTVVETATTIDGYKLSETTYDVTVNGAATETDADGKTTGNIVLSNVSDTAVVEFTNSYDAIGSLKLVKTVSGDKGWDDLSTVSFTVKKGSTTVVTKTKTDFSETSTGVYTCTIDELEPGDYTVIENFENFDGYTRKTTYTTTATTATTTDAELTATGTTVAVAGGLTKTVAINNDYQEESHPASLTITKTVSGLAAGTTWDDVKGKISFTISPAINEKTTVTGEELDATSHSYTFEDLDPSQTYTITETATAPTGYVVKSTTYTVKVGDGDTSNATTATSASDVTLEADKETIVAFTNTYEELAKLNLYKTVSGDKAWADVASITFTVKKGDTPVETKTKDDFSEASTGVYTCTVEGLEAGTYTVSETCTDFDGFSRTTTYKVNATSASTTDTVLPTDGANITLAAGATGNFAVNNDYDEEEHPAKLTIKKTISGFEDGTTWDDVKDKISFTISPAIEGKTTVTGAELEGDDHHYTFEDLDPNTTYTITETATAPDSYKVKSTSYTVKVGDEAAGSPVTSASASNVALAGDKETVVAFTNNYEKYASILLTKTVSGEKEWDDIESISFVVKKGADVVITKTKADFSVSPSGGYSCAIEGIDAGTYTISEVCTDISGYTRSATYTTSGAAATTTDTVLPAAGASITLSAGEIGNFAINNHYTENTLPAKLTIKKTVSGFEDGTSWDDAKDKISFTISPAIGGKTTVTGAELEGDDHHYTFENLDPNTTYTITETATAPDSYKVKSTSYTVKVGDGDASSPVTSASASNIALAGGKETVVAFTNNYEKLAKLLLTKTVSGDKEWDDIESISFVVKKGADVIETKTKTDFSVSASGGYSCAIEGIDAGTYTVSEVCTDISGYTRSATYTTSGATATTTDTALPAAGASITLSAGEIGNFAINNHYTENSHPASLTITKTVSGLADGTTWDDVKGKISFAISPAIGEKSTVTGAELDATSHSYTFNDLDPSKTYTITETATAPTGHVVKSTSYTVKVGDGDTSNATTSTSASDVALEGDKETIVAFTNTYEELAQLILNKTVDGDLEWDDLTDITFTVKKGDDVIETKEKDDFSNGPSGVKTCTITGLAAGTYTVIESSADVTGYTRTTTYNVTAMAGENDPTLPANGADIELAAGDTKSFSVLNKYEENPSDGKLVITKTVSGVTSDEAEENIEFTIVDPDGGTDVVPLSDFGRTGGVYTYEIDPAAAGTYTVTESSNAIDGYVLDAVSYVVSGGDSGSGTGVTKAVSVVAGETTTIAYTNEYSEEIGKLIISKEVKGDLSWNQVKNTLKFKVTKEGESTGTTINATSFTDGDGDGIYTYAISGLTPGKYVVKEIVTTPSGYVLKTESRIVGVSAYDDGTKVTATVVADGSVTAAFRNTYKDNRGNLEITKTLKGNPDKALAEKTITFAVTNNTTKKTTEYKLSQFSKVNGNYVLTLKAIAGGYTVTEKVCDLDGYETVKVTYSVDGSKDKAGKTTTVMVADGTTKKVKFTDEYKAKKKTTKPNNPEKPKRIVPKTGDESPIGLWMAVCAVSILGMGAGVVGLKRRRKNK